MGIRMTYREAHEKVVFILKGRFNNLTVEEVNKLAYDIVDAVCFVKEG